MQHGPDGEAWAAPSPYSRCLYCGALQVLEEPILTWPVATCSNPKCRRIEPLSYFKPGG